MYREVVTRASRVHTFFSKSSDPFTHHTHGKEGKKIGPPNGQAATKQIDKNIQNNMSWSR